jgi:hypothetical protein
MTVTFNERLLAYLALISGLVISIVAEYYSILGLTAIFSAAAIPVIIMGIALGVGKITATLWLKQNWTIAPWSIRSYLLSAIAVLMLITSMGIFGFLSKAHSDQSLVSGDVQSKIAVYDEKIKTARENIESDRKQLKQMDEAVDQVMGRSTDEKGADKANAIRKSQQRDRIALARDIETNQKLISSLNDEAAPIRAEVRKVEAEVGPIKYIAAFVYGQTDTTVLEKAVTWVIIILIVVFDPLAVILLLSSQISFQNFRERNRWDFERDLEEAADAFNDVFADELANTDKTSEEIMGYVPDPYVADVGEKPTAEELAEIELNYPYEPVRAKEVKEVIPEAVVEEKEPVRTVITGNRPVRKTRIFKTPPQTLTTVTEDLVQEQLEADNRHTVTHMGNGYVQVDGQMYHEGSVPPHIQGYIQNEEQRESGQWSKVKKDEE